MNPPLDQVIRDVLDPLIPPSAPLALFDFPNYSNVGDSAIWLGEQDYLRTQRPDCRIVWMSDLSVAKATPLPVLPRNCVILIQGGGNFGDIWPQHQKLREHVLAHYPGHRVIQLPQSIHFRDTAQAERSRPIFSAHSDFHLVVRDHESMEFASRLYDCHVHLCPDMALHLRQWPRRVIPHHRLFGLMRTDRERASAAPPSDLPGDLVVDDWLEEAPTLAMQADAALSRLESRYPNHFSVPQFLRQRLYARIALQRMHRGCDQLASGHVVITDRLHAHILCTLMGIPHVVLDNSYRKIGNFRAAWHTGDGLCRTANTLEAALAEVTDLVPAR